MREYESPSSLELYDQCPLAYHYRYIDEVVTAPTLSQWRGSLVHCIVELIVRTEGKVTPAIVRGYVESEVMDIKDQYIWQDGKRFTGKRSPTELVEHLVDSDNLALLNKVASKYQEFITEVEYKMNIWGANLKGRMDLISYDENSIVDLKTVSQSEHTETSEKRCRTSIQAILYSVMYALRFDTIPEFTHTFIVLNKKFKVREVTHTYTQEEMEHYSKVLQNIVGSITDSYKNDHWPERISSCVGRFVCPYYSLCHSDALTT